VQIAVINSGSSSLKCKLFNMQTKEVLYSVLIENIGEIGAEFKNHHDALESIDIDFCSLDVIGHRVVHGGEFFSEATLIDNNVIARIKELIPLAPLHNFSNLEGIIIARTKAPNIPHIAVFDTAFHTNMPKEAYLYALNKDMYEKHHIRRYGFHGTSHSYVSKKAAKILKKDINRLNLITLHLGNGASICAIKNGKSIDTSMGFTPLEGLVMGTRCGDIDPSIALYMQRELGMNVDEVDKELNKNSGLQGICNENDVRKILNNSNESSELALKIMIRRIQKYIGSYMVLLETVDAVVFAGGIGENSQYIREKIFDNALIKKLDSIVIETNEELEIATQCMNVHSIVISSS
jgi:acetate kinase